MQVKNKYCKQLKVAWQLPSRDQCSKLIWQTRKWQPTASPLVLPLAPIAATCFRTELTVFGSHTPFVREGLHISSHYSNFHAVLYSHIPSILKARILISTWFSIIHKIANSFHVWTATRPHRIVLFNHGKPITSISEWTETVIRTDSSTHHNIAPPNHSIIAFAI